MSNVDLNAENFIRRAKQDPALLNGHPILRNYVLNNDVFQVNQYLRNFYNQRVLSNPGQVDSLLARNNMDVSSEEVQKRM